MPYPQKTSTGPADLKDLEFLEAADPRVAGVPGVAGFVCTGEVLESPKNRYEKSCV